MCELPAHIKGKKESCASLHLRPGQCNHQHFFILFGLECVRLWNMGNFSLESYYTLLRYKEDRMVWQVAILVFNHIGIHHQE